MPGRSHRISTSQTSPELPSQAQYEQQQETMVLKRLTVEQITDTYRKGYITAAQQNDILRRKAQVTMDTRLDEDGYAMTVFRTWIGEIQQGWDNATLSMGSDPQQAMEQGVIAGSLQSMWGQIQILIAPFVAFGAVNGKVAERLALEAGASPGLAKVINFATDMGSQLVPTGKVAQSFGKGVQKIGGKLAARAAGKAEKVAAAAEKLAGDLPPAAKAAMAQGLATDGVKVEQIAGIFGDDAVRVGVKIVPPPSGVSASQQFADDLARFHAEMKGITATKAHAVTLREAEKLGLSLDDVRAWLPGEAVNEAHMAAGLKALEPQVKRLGELVKAVQQSPTDENLEALARYGSEFLSISPRFRAAEVTAGRSVEILKETPPMKRLTDVLMGFDPANVANGDFRSAMLTFADDLAAMIDEPAKLKVLAIQNQTMLAQMGQEWWPKARAAYTSLLVAQPITHVRNVTGNSIAMTNAVLERSLGGAFSLDPGKGIAGAKEGLYLAKGMRYAIGDGIAALKQSYQGLSPGEINKLDFVPVRFTGRVSLAFNVPLDTLRAGDNFFKTLLTRGSHYAVAFRDGSQRGLLGDDLAKFITQRVTMPTRTMLDEAAAFAEYNTFQNDLGRIGTAARALQTGPLALWFPFMKTPLNLAKYAWNRTPGLQLVSGSLYRDILAGGVAADMAIGRLTLSNLTAFFLYDLAQEGLLTGSGPVDPGLRRAWLGRYQPYSVKVGEGWVPIRNLEPASTIPGLVADFAQILNQLDDPTAEQTAMAISLSISRDLVDKTYWRTLGDLVDLSASIRTGEEPGPYAKKILLGPATTILTGGPLVAGIARSVDPVRRETRSWMDDITARVPGYSQTLPPMRDGLGEPILPPQTVGSKWLGIASPLRYKEQTNDPVAIATERLGVKLPKFPWNLGGRMQDEFDVRAPVPGDRLPVTLSPQQRDRWQVLYRDLLRSPRYGIESQLFPLPSYRNAPQALQREMLTGHLSSLRSAARDALLTEDTGLMEKVINAQADRYAPMLQEGEQRQLREQITQSTDLLRSMAPESRRNLLRWGVISEEPTAEETP